MYVLSSKASDQKLEPGVATPSSSPWWGTGWFWGEEPTINFAELVPEQKLERGER